MYAAVAFAAALLAVTACSSGRSETPSLLVVAFDTTRADRLALYGGGRPTSPALDRLATDARVYENAFTTSSDELAAYASLLTGLAPTHHGARLDPEGSLALGDVITAPDAFSVFRAIPLRADVATLAEILGRRGYATAAVIAGPWLKRPSGLARGFAYYDDEGIVAPRGRDGTEVTDRALAWLEGRKGPFFLFVHYFDPHAPYEPPLELARGFLGANLETLPAQPDLEQTRALYDAELRHADAQLGRLLDGLRARGLYDGTVIVVTASHGELLGEHSQLGHGSTLYQEEVRIPLLVKAPKGAAAPGRSDEPASLADVVPIALASLGLPVPEGLDGALPESAGRPIYGELRPLPSRRPAGDLRMWIELPWKLVWSRDGKHELFDLGRDPGEAHDLAAEEPERFAAIRERLEKHAIRLEESRRGADP